MGNTILTYCKFGDLRKREICQSFGLDEEAKKIIDNILTTWDRLNGNEEKMLTTAVSKIIGHPQHSSIFFALAKIDFELGLLNTPPENLHSC